MKTKKAEFIKKYGEDAYEKQQEETRNWQRTHPEQFRAIHKNTYHKGGKYYEETLRKNRTGVRGKRGNMRSKHGRIYRPYKRIIAPNSVLHHEWILGTANYRGVALVEKEPHQYGYIDVIQILEGEITLFTEPEIRGAIT